MGAKEGETYLKQRDIWKYRGSGEQILHRVPFWLYFLIVFGVGLFICDEVLAINFKN